MVEIDRVESALVRHPRLKDRLFTQAERDYCESHARPYVHFALRFAAKEAIAKVIGTGMKGFSFADIEVLRDERGKPYPVLKGPAQDAAEAAGVSRIYLSLSYTAKNAVASAIAVGEEG